MADQRIPPPLAEPPLQSGSLLGGKQLVDGVGVERGGIDRAALELIEAAAVAAGGHAFPTAGEVNGHVIAGQHAIAIEKQQPLAVGQASAIISHAGEAKAIVWPRREGDPKGGIRCPPGDEFGGFVGGAVVGDHHLKASYDALLLLNRIEHQFEMPRLHVGVDDQGNLGNCWVRGHVVVFLAWRFRVRHPPGSRRRGLRPRCR